MVLVLLFCPMLMQIDFLKPQVSILQKQPNQKKSLGTNYASSVHTLRPGVFPKDTADCCTAYLLHLFSGTTVAIRQSPRTY